MTLKKNGVNEMRTINKYIAAASAIGMMLFTATSCGESEKAAAPADLSSGEAVEASAQVTDTEAVYLGVKDYGSEDVNMDNKPEFKYRFEVDGKEQIYSVFNGTKDGRVIMITPYRTGSKRTTDTIS